MGFRINAIHCISLVHDTWAATEYVITAVCKITRAATWHVVIVICKRYNSARNVEYGSIHPLNLK